MIAAVVIASGFSRRMGRSKLDLELGTRTFLQRVLAAASGTRGVGRCLLVVGPEDKDSAAPPAERKLRRSVMPPKRKNQYDIAFSRGNARSRAPYINGTR